MNAVQEFGGITYCVVIKSMPARTNKPKIYLPISMCNKIPHLYKEKSYPLV